MFMSDIRIGTAAWSIPGNSKARFPSAGSSLERYAAVFSAVEINSSFHRRHKPDTWKRWADSVPDDFRFSVKLPKAITHENRLEEAGALISEFAGDVSHLARKLGPVLVQLPPNLTFDAVVAKDFLTRLRQAFRGSVVIEPRHSSWTGDEVAQLLEEFAIDRVHADPAPIPNADTRRILYLRLHGSPRIYYSEYDGDALASYAVMLRSCPSPAWCIFDNTASGAAILNALDMLTLVVRSPERSPAAGH
jgi:uncharacterized protein YecE (DUF72 family)